ncbi:hypothetical protein TWF696_003452 [Orbilia brochopaga]|uniref:Uncharacterized protein n=1 Tax=Orbilia brochopaga TaxID=3140254 RepID=A0AAV9TYQ2_9PEZI
MLWILWHRHRKRLQWLFTNAHPTSHCHMRSMFDDMLDGNVLYHISIVLRSIGYSDG